MEKWSKILFLLFLSTHCALSIVNYGKFYVYGSHPDYTVLDPAEPFNQSGQFTYSVVTSGMCNSVDGRHDITNNIWCKEAALSPNGNVQPYDTANCCRPSTPVNGQHNPQVQSTSSWLNGCFTNTNGHLYFNSYAPGEPSGSPRGCSHYDRCLCANLAICSVTDGTASNAATCSCGDSICTPTTGLFCLFSTVWNEKTWTGDKIHSQCSSSAISACNSSDGTSANSVTCVCGTRTCNSNTGLFCRSEKKSGLIAGANGYTQDWYNTAIKLTNPECSHTPIFYSLVNNGDTCESVSERQVISDKGVCKEAVAQFKMVVYLPVYSQYYADLYRYIGIPAPTDMSSASDPPGCLHDGTFYFNSLSTSLTKCQSPKRCICATGPPCLDNDGLTASSDGCICNAAICTAQTGLYCDNSTSTCSRGNACTNTDGSLANSDACPCGTSYCYAVTGLYCISSLNLCGKACSLGEYRSTVTNGTCTKCPVGRHSDHASDMTQCKLW